MFEEVCISVARFYVESKDRGFLIKRSGLCGFGSRHMTTYALSCGVQAACVQQVLNKIEGNVHRKPRRGGDHGNAKAGASKGNTLTCQR